tara:strand:+ start:185 stop:952 length:768 start_codon:yes stop_codon:yes gene_type:complete
LVLEINKFTIYIYMTLLERQVSIGEEVDGEQLFSIWGSSEEDIQKYKEPHGPNRTNNTEIVITPKYIPNKNDKIRIYSMINRGTIIVESVYHATVLIDSANNGKTYSMGFSSGKNNKLCIFSPDPAFITMMRNKPRDISDDLIHQQDEISKRSIDKLHKYLGNTKGSFPARRKIPKVCYDELEYKAIFSRQRGGFNCWTAIEDIFPLFTRSIRETIPSVSAFLARGAKTLKKSSKSKRKKSKRKKSKRKKSKRKR